MELLRFTECAERRQEQDHKPKLYAERADGKCGAQAQCSSKQAGEQRSYRRCAQCDHPHSRVDSPLQTIWSYRLSQAELIDCSHRASERRKELRCYQQWNYGLVLSTRERDE